MSYDRILAAAAATPWAILPEKGRQIAEMLTVRAAGEDVPPAVRAAAVAAKREAAPRKPGAVGVVPVYGTLTQRADLMSEWSGGASAEAVGREIDALAADPGIEAIVLDIDSPGGSVYGIPELAAKVAAAARLKPVTAQVNSLAASAAYWIASQATEVVVTPGGEVGSIGVVAMHTDKSAALGRVGHKVTLVTAGDLKIADHPYGPLTADGMAVMKKSVDDYYGMFVSAVAAGRKTTEGRVRTGFGRGDVVRAAEAVAEGMADRIGTLDDTLARLSRRAATGPRADAGDDGIEVRRRKLRLLTCAARRPALG